MGQLKTQITSLQHKAFLRWLEGLLVLLTILVLQHYLCLINIVNLVRFYLLHYLPHTLNRLVHQMVFRERFAVFR